MLIDLTTEFGQRVARRLKEERIIWLSTVDADGTPQPRPVWFLWNDSSFLIYSRPNTAKMRHIGRHPAVSLHLDSDGRGGDIVVITGRAEIEPEALPAYDVPEYVDKYEAGFKRIGMSAAEFAADYQVAIRVWPLSLRGH